MRYIGLSSVYLNNILHNGFGGQTGDQSGNNNHVMSYIHLYFTELYCSVLIYGILLFLQVSWSVKLDHIPMQDNWTTINPKSGLLYYQTWINLIQARCYCIKS